MLRIWLLVLLLAFFGVMTCSAAPNINYQQQLRHLQKSFPNQMFPVEHSRRLLYGRPRAAVYDDEVPIGLMY